MTIDEKIRDGKLQDNVNKEVAKRSALSSGKIDKYEYLTGKEIIPSDQKQLIEQIKFKYGPLGKALEKQTKTMRIKEKNKLKQLKSTINNYLNLMTLKSTGEQLKM